MGFMGSSARAVTGSQAAIAKAAAMVAQRVVLLTDVYVFIFVFLRFTVVVVCFASIEEANRRATRLLSF
jgi:hypothetical protein